MAPLRSENTPVRALANEDVDTVRAVPSEDIVNGAFAPEGTLEARSAAEIEIPPKPAELQDRPNWPSPHKRLTTKHARLARQSVLVVRDLAGS
jgi:hypothetical protein